VKMGHDHDDDDDDDDDDPTLPPKTSAFARSLALSL